MTTEAITVENERQVLAQLQAIDRKVQRRTVRRATTAAGKVALNESRRQATTTQVTGFFRRSLTTKSKSKKGRTTVYVGQAKQKSFKARKSTRVKNKNLSQIQRGGKPVPIHWIERGTKPHIIRARGGGRLVFQTGRRTRGNRALAFAKQVRNPGMKGRDLLLRTAKIVRTPARNAFLTVVQQDLAQLPKQ